MPSEKEKPCLRSKPFVPWTHRGHVAKSSDISREVRISDFYMKSNFPILTIDLNIKHSIDQQYVI